MSRPSRIQLSRRPGWRMPPGTVKVDRSTQWGNPFRVGEPVDLKVGRRWGWSFGFPERQASSMAEAVKMFEDALAFDDASQEAVREELRGRSLACWCRLGEPCHADVLLRIANEEPA